MKTNTASRKWATDFKEIQQDRRYANRPDHVGRARIAIAIPPNIYVEHPESDEQREGDRPAQNGERCPENPCVPFIVLAVLRGAQATAEVEGRLLSGAWRIGRVMVKAGLRELLTRSRPDDTESMLVAVKRFRQALDELGPTFAKLGQILSTRPDLLPPPFTEELASLQERVTPLSEAEVVYMMK